MTDHSESGGAGSVCTATRAFVAHSIYTVVYILNIEVLRN